MRGGRTVRVFAGILALACGGAAVGGRAREARAGVLAVGWRTLGTGVFAQELPAVGAGAQNNTVVALAGWRITAASTQAWLTALHASRLRALGVRRLYAVQGPVHVDYRGHELATEALANELVARANAGPGTVLVVSHSSGSHVAAELFYRLFHTRSDRGGALRGRVLFVSLDGDPEVPSDPTRRLSAETVGGLRHAWFVTARDPARGLDALSNGAMRAQQRRYAAQSDFVEYDARDAGCTSRLCVHLSVVNARPSARGNDSYARFATGAPNTFWLDRALPRWER